MKVASLLRTRGKTQFKYHSSKHKYESDDRIGLRRLSQHHDNEKIHLSSDDL